MAKSQTIIPHLLPGFANIWEITDTCSHSQIATDLGSFSKKALMILIPRKDFPLPVAWAWHPDWKPDCMVFSSAAAWWGLAIIGAIIIYAAPSYQFIRYTIGIIGFVWRVRIGIKLSG